MILYVNGDSHAAAAEAVNLHAFAEDDPQLFYMGRAPHPANFEVSWPRMVSFTLKSALNSDAESASSNTRILRTTREWLDNNKHHYPETTMIIQWSTWEREEWLHDGIYYQIGASGLDDVPDELKEKYKHFVVGVDWRQKTQQAHDEIWQLHQELESKNIRHVFFNGNNDFAIIPEDQRHDWGINYIGPYDPDATYDSWLRRNGFMTVAPNSWHFGKEAHNAWGRFVLKYIVNNNLVP